MPRVSDAYLTERRGQVLFAAARCFSRDGFHRTSMDAVIAESGLSAGAVYRYFRSKDELIVGVAQEAMGQARTAMRRLLAEAPGPPATALAGVVAAVAALPTSLGFDPTRIAVQAWAEAQRNPVVAEMCREVYGEARGWFAELAAHWQAEGHLASDADPREVAQACFSLLPGLIVQRLLLGDVDPDGYARGVAALVGGSRS